MVVSCEGSITCQYFEQGNVVGMWSSLACFVHTWNIWISFKIKLSLHLQIQIWLDQRKMFNDTHLQVMQINYVRDTTGIVMQCFNEKCWDSAFCFKFLWFYGENRKRCFIHFYPLWINLALKSILAQCSIFIPSENFKKPLAFWLLQRIQRWNIRLK